MNVCYCLFLLLTFFSRPRISKCFYAATILPTEYHKGEQINLKAVKLSSIVNPIAQDYSTLPMCHPHPIMYDSETLGELLHGDLIVNTRYRVKMASNQPCIKVCPSDMLTLNVSQSMTWRELIVNKYRVNLIVDNLPVATRTKNSADAGGEFRYEPGFPLGFIDVNGRFAVNNHLKFILSYHKLPHLSEDGKESYRVVGFLVEPFSVKHSMYSDESASTSCTLQDSWDDLTEELNHEVIPKEKAVKIKFSYSVEWIESDVKWASRWDAYWVRGSPVSGAFNSNIHLFSIINSIVVVIALTTVVFAILVRTLRKDIDRYNLLSDSVSEEDNIMLLDMEMEATFGGESGWKLLHGDVFRAPKRITTLVALIGTGTQLFGMAFVSLALILMGITSPNLRGSIMTGAIVAYEMMGYPAGFVAGKLYRTWKGRGWKWAAFSTASLYPTLICATGILLDFFIWKTGTKGTTPTFQILVMSLIWFILNLPLVSGGFLHGYKSKPFRQPTRTNRIPRHIPVRHNNKPFYMNNITMLAVIAGILPFGVSFVELFFIFSAIYQNTFYFMFGFLFLVLLILVVCVSQISIVSIYYQLCGEDYRWWWQSFIVGGGSSIYLFLYTIFYYYAKLNIQHFMPSLMYFASTSVMILTYWLVTSAIGFFAAYAFILTIYSVVKID